MSRYLAFVDKIVLKNAKRILFFDDIYKRYFYRQKIFINFVIISIYIK